MAIGGSLITMQPAELLQWICTGRKTGTLMLRNGPVQRTILFEHGGLVSTASNDPRHYLGQYLIDHGILTPVEHESAMSLQRESNIFLGKILVMIDAITEEALVKVLKEKAEEELFEVFFWEEGDFHFDDHEVSVEDMIPLWMDVTRIVLEGAQRVDEAKRWLYEAMPDTRGAVHPEHDPSLDRVRNLIIDPDSAADGDTKKKD